jgi:hypothetical protein
MLVSFVVLVSSCGDKGDDVLTRIDFENKIQLIELSKRVLGNEVVTAFGGFFDESPRKKIAAVIETDENIDWGIKFVLLEENKGKLETIFQTLILPGSHRESFLDKIKFPSFGYELLYYNSQAYFIGSGGGEIYSYIIDFGNKEVYSAHLVAEPRKPAFLFISPNTNNKDIKNFFTQIFRKDYPGLKLTDQDISLE